MKKKKPSKLLRNVLFMAAPLSLFVILALSLVLAMAMPTPNINVDFIPTYKQYANLIGADWQLLAAYDLAIHNNQVDDLDPEGAAWFFMTVKFTDKTGQMLNGKSQIQNYFGENLSFIDAYNRFADMNSASNKDLYEIGSKDIVSLESRLSDEEFKWVELLIANNVLLQLDGGTAYQGAAYQKLIFENKGYFAMPLANGTFTVSSRGFGYKMHPIKKKLLFHSGQDFGAASGTPVGASAEGVASVRWDPDGYGKYVIIYHPNGMSTLYGHLSVVSVIKGQGVEKGELIGRVGTTGGSTGPHLHFEIRKNGQYLDPMKFLK